MTPYYEQDGITIYHGDCREVLPFVGPVDLVLTDPPYGNGTHYLSYVDSASALRVLIASIVPELLRKAKRVLITPGVANVHLYPPSDWILSWHTPAGAGSGPWGFACWQPILAYGADPYLATGKGRRPDSFVRTVASEVNGHPCPKPIGVWEWVLLRGSASGSDVVLDPFMGSGTTLRAAKNLGRRAIGIEIEERYCEIAAKRLSQQVMFGSEVEWLAALGDCAGVESYMFRPTDEADVKRVLGLR